MDQNTQQAVPAIGEAFGGGSFAGRIRIDGNLYNLIVAPKGDGEHKPAIWIPNDKDVPDAKSYDDGLANTKAMAADGSKLAKWALDLRIGGHDDWYLPSQDELELAYRHLKPTTDENWCYARSGINLSAETPTRPYTPEFPVQTTVDAFMSGGDQAFEASLYWSSTQHAATSDSAWCQNFDDGDQSDFSKSDELRARAVRRELVIQ
jgi:hypothetical protein